MLDLIIKNGQCYINKNLERVDIGISNGKISNIGDLSNNKAKNTYQ